MELANLIEYASAYTKLGWAIQAQVNDIADGDYADLNINAVREIERHLKGFNEDLDAAIVEALEACSN